MLKLGTIVTDTATKTKGMLTIYNYDSSGNIFYLFQPAELNPETKLPMETFWCAPKRIAGAIEIHNDPIINFAKTLLGSEVEDIATGFKGMALSLSYFINGCIHLTVKSKEKNAKTKELVKDFDFDLRRLKGKLIPKMSDKEKEKDRIKRPSPEFRPPLDKC